MAYKRLLSRDARKLDFGISDQARHKPACTLVTGYVARSLKFRIQGDGGLYYPCSKNKGADQLCSYCTKTKVLISCAVIYIYRSLSKNGAIQKGKTKKKIIVQFFLFNDIVSRAYRI